LSVLDAITRGIPHHIFTGDAFDIAREVLAYALSISRVLLRLEDRADTRFVVGGTIGAVLSGSAGYYISQHVDMVGG